MAQHVGVGLEAQLGGFASSLDHAREASGGEGRPALAGEDERRGWILLPLQPAQRPQLVATDWMGRRRALLDPADMQGRGVEVDLIRAKVGEFRHTQAVPEGHQDHGGVAMSPAVFPGGLDQPFDLGLGQVFPGPVVRIGSPGRVTVRFSMAGGTSLRGNSIIDIRAPKDRLAEQCTFYEQ